MRTQRPEPSSYKRPPISTSSRPEVHRETEGERGAEELREGNGDLGGHVSKEDRIQGQAETERERLVEAERLFLNSWLSLPFSVPVRLACSSETAC